VKSPGPDPDPVTVATGARIVIFRNISSKVSSVLPVRFLTIFFTPGHLIPTPPFSISTGFFLIPRGGVACGHALFLLFFRYQKGLQIHDVMTCCSWLAAASRLDLDIAIARLVTCHHFTYVTSLFETHHFYIFRLVQQPLY
jgi:hypothetical protein